MANKCVYVGIFEGEKVYLALYLDDGLLLSRELKSLEKLAAAFKAEFEITIGDLNSLVGMEIIRDKGSVFIHQSTYISKILQK